MSKSQRDNGEAKLQVAFINWMRSACPDVVVFHVYNENAVSEIQGKIKKDRGVLAGVHDNILLYAPSKMASIELKSPNKRPSENKYSDKQQTFAERMDKIGWPHFCCQTGEQCEAAVRSLGLVPLFKFPLSLASTGKQMLMAQVFEAMRP